MIITFSLDQGPFFMTVAGEVLPLLPLFGLEFTRGQYTPTADAYVEPDTGYYHILLMDMGWGEERLSPQIFHENTGLVEMLNQDDEVYLLPDGLLVANHGGVNWIRPITAVDEPWQRQPDVLSLQCTPTSPYFAQSPTTDRVDIYVWPDCQLRLKLQLAWTAEGVRGLNAGFSPDNQWLVLTPTDGYGRNLALFLIPVDKLEGM